MIAKRCRIGAVLFLGLCWSGGVGAAPQTAGSGYKGVAWGVPAEEAVGSLGGGGRVLTEMPAGRDRSAIIGEVFELPVDDDGNLPKAAGEALAGVKVWTSSDLSVLAVDGKFAAIDITAPGDKPDSLLDKELVGQVRKKYPNKSGGRVSTLRATKDDRGRTDYRETIRRECRTGASGTAVIGFYRIQTWGTQNYEFVPLLDSTRLSFVAIYDAAVITGMRQAIDKLLADEAGAATSAREEKDRSDRQKVKDLVQ